MFQSAVPRIPLGLRAQAALISFFLLVLIGLLGVRAYSVARAELRDLTELSGQDLKVQSDLTQLEGEIAARDQAARKLRVTHDPIYAQLVVRHEEALEALSRTLSGALPASIARLSPDAWQTAAQVDATHRALESARNDRIARAHEASLGLLRLIAGALALTIGLTAWLLTLFFRGLLRPLKRLDQGLSRIREGELSFRLSAGAGRDEGVAELRALAESFNAMAQRLEALDQAKTEFLATISHEIRNPLAALKEGLNLLATQGALLSPESRERAFAACLIASKRLESMINNLLHHSRMESGLYDFDLTLKDLASAVQTAIAEVRPLAEKKRMRIEYCGQPQVLAAFNWDGMVQVFENLLLNAIKYGHEDSVIEIRIAPTQRAIRAAGAQTPAGTAQRAGGRSVPHFDVSVTNSSPRLDDSELPHLFDRFYRASTSLPTSGMGLGLHVVKRIVEAHHGGVSAHSDGEKTRVQFWIPGRYETEAAG